MGDHRSPAPELSGPGKSTDFLFAKGRGRPLPLVAGKQLQGGSAHSRYTLDRAPKAPGYRLVRSQGRGRVDVSAKGFLYNGFIKG
ncbi:hypothetical protein JCM15519_08290 [Fundidesulfovibrio butyratiphilus]